MILWPGVAKSKVANGGGIGGKEGGTGGGGDGDGGGDGCVELELEGKARRYQYVSSNDWPGARSPRFQTR